MYTPIWNCQLMVLYHLMISKQELKQRLGWLLNPKFRDTKLTQRVPKRPFIGVTPQTRKAVRKILGVELMEVD